MGSTPTQKIEADLDGNGALIDLTGSISAWQVNMTYPNGVVDMVAGIKHFRGRTDWTQAEQQPGTLTFTVDNSSGRFTPGAGAPGNLNSWAAYARGFRPGVLVKWTCNGTRVRHFRMGVPKLGFNRSTGASTTTVTCYDALGDFARQKLSSMMVEEIKARHPVVYYPLTDAVATAGATGALDQSGRSQPPLTPHGAGLDSQLNWATANGPPADGKSSLTFRKDVATPVVNTRGVAAGLRVEPYATPRATINWGTTTLAWAVSFWLSYQDIYGAPSGTPGLTDGPYVALPFVRGEFAAQQPTFGYQMLMRIEDRRLMLCDSAGAIIKLSDDSYSVSPTDLHHVMFTVRQETFGSYWITTQLWLDGVALTARSQALGGPQYTTLSGLPVEICPGGRRSAGPSGDVIYALHGSISHLSVHGPPDVTYTGPVSTPAKVDAAGGLSMAQAVWRAGKLALTESVANRVARFGSYETSAATVTTAGTAMGFTVGTQDTSGKSLLSAMCSALRGDDAHLLAETVSGVERVTARLGSLHRSSTPTLTIDVDRDCDGAPALTFDTSGAATRATATGATVASSSTVSATHTDPAPLDLASDQSVESAFVDQLDVLGLAQQRVAVGRTERLTVSEITVNASSSIAALTSSLLDLQPGQTVRLTGLPMSRLTGVTSGPTGTTSAVTVVVVGVEETHSVGGSTFRLILQPYRGEGYIGDTDLRLVGSHDSTGTSYDLSLESAMTSGQTTMVVSTPNSTKLSTDSADYPCYFAFQGTLPFEIVYCPNPPGSATASGVAPATHVQQTFTGVTRAALGSSAVAHSANDRIEFAEGATAEFLPMPYVGF